MPFFQPPVHPPPKDATFKGKTAIITGANTGLGLATARELLRLQCKTLILACRDPARAKQARESLLKEYPSITPENLQIKSLDLDSYRSVKAFAEEIRRDVPVIDLLVLNAGAGFFAKPQTSTEGHERTIQVMFLSNVLLILCLLLHLQASALQSGHPARITWIGSRRATSVGAGNRPFPDSPQGLFEYLNDPKNYQTMSRYGESKFLCLVFMQELARRVSPERVELNMVCPGAIATDLSRNLPPLMKAIVPVYTALRSRSPEQGAWLVVNAAVVVGRESHGGFYGDTSLEAVPYLESSVGKETRRKVWEATMEEMRKAVVIPKELE